MAIYQLDDETPDLHPSAWVADSAAVIGRVTLGENANVWYGAVLRADLQAISVGARTSIQDNAVIHVDEPDAPTMVAEDVTIGHAAILHGCRVERGALIGMHATVLNKAVIGEEAIVAAGAMVTPGMVVPPRTLVAGVPAKVRRAVTDEELDHLRRGVRSYLELKTRFMAADDERELAEPDDWGKLS